MFISGNEVDSSIIDDVSIPETVTSDESREMLSLSTTLRP